ncbi:hypothetical protein PVA38_11140 [Streptococcus pneumoniae D39]|nr:hypothetical protein PVA38_11140 [Streptococcus pneumoniae D39]
MFQFIQVTLSVQTEKSLIRIKLLPQTLYVPVSYTHLRAHETVLDLVCRLLLEKKKYKHTQSPSRR